MVTRFGRSCIPRLFRVPPTHQVVDPVGNAAIPAKRLIFIACPDTESYCIVKGMKNTPSCTVDGVCSMALKSGEPYFVS